MRYISLCASSDDVTSEVASILAKFVGTPGISSAGIVILRNLGFYGDNIPFHNSNLNVLIFLIRKLQP